MAVTHRDGDGPGLECADGTDTTRGRRPWQQQRLPQLQAGRVECSINVCDAVGAGDRPRRRWQRRCPLWKNSQWGRRFRDGEEGGSSWCRHPCPRCHPRRLHLSEEKWVKVLPWTTMSPSRAAHIMADENWGESLRMTASQLLQAGTHYHSPPSTSTSSERGS